MKNPTLVVLTDRNDPDEQLFATFSRCQDLLRQPPEQAQDRADLRKKLDQHRALGSVQPRLARATRPAIPRRPSASRGTRCPHHQRQAPPSRPGSTSRDRTPHRNCTTVTLNDGVPCRSSVVRPFAGIRFRNTQPRIADASRIHLHHHLRARPQAVFRDIHGRAGRRPVPSVVRQLPRGRRTRGRSGPSCVRGGSSRLHRLRLRRSGARRGQDRGGLRGRPGLGFSEMMQAFGSALSPEQLQRVMNYIRTMCTDADWPRDELNLPRPLVTGKAYPEDEWVVSASLPVDGTGDGGAEFVYEQRFGPRSQWEVAIPYEWERWLSHVERQVDQVERRLLKGEDPSRREGVLGVRDAHALGLEGQGGQSVGTGRAGVRRRGPVSVQARLVGVVAGGGCARGRAADRGGPGNVPGDLRACSSDKGFHSPANRVRLDALLPEGNVLPQKGKLGKAARARETEAAFVVARRRHPSVESGINHLQHHGLARVRTRGAAGPPSALLLVGVCTDVTGHFSTVTTARLRTTRTEPVPEPLDLRSRPPPTVLAVARHRGRRSRSQGAAEPSARRSRDAVLHAHTRRSWQANRRTCTRPCTQVDQ